MNEKYVVFDPEFNKVLAITLDEKIANALVPLFSALISVEVRPIGYFDFFYEPIRVFLNKP